MNFDARRWFPVTVLAGLVALSISGCTQQEVRPEAQAALLSGYTCCNFHYEKDWINDGNYGQLPMIPAGTPIKVLDYGRYRVQVDIDGKPFRLGLDYGREAETTEQWVAKLVVAKDPKVQLAAYPAAVQQAIQKGQVMVGMTKEQVIMSLGYPLTNENPRLDAPFWRYWWSSFGEYQVNWQGDRVSKITGNPETVQLVLAPGNAVAAAPAAAPATAPAAAQAAPAGGKTSAKQTAKNSGGKKNGKKSAAAATGNKQ